MKDIFMKAFVSLCASRFPDKDIFWTRQGFQDLEADAAEFSLISKSAAALCWPDALVLGGPTMPERV